ncbi:DUF2169 domain-containing protein [Sorangium sp. So ce1024]|uniref:DUF2169 family type VI secretion system accessory protein n=1 Tax=unclassified Sorangium TaxID=2621164 RepID=UPI003F0C06FA
MQEPALPSDAVTALPGTSATAMAWRTAQGQLHLTTIVKATFAFAPDAEMPLVEPQPVFRAEVHNGNNPLRGIRFTSDLAPYLGRADVLFTGYAHAPRGTRVQSMHVRLAIADSSRVLLDRQLLVRDRDGFERMPLTCDRATSGVDGQENPFGRGPDPAAANIVDPRDPSRPAGFGPIARALPARRRRLGSTPRKVLEAPIAEIPDGFDWGYFQAAPEGQQIDHLRGGEWILLEGLHPSLPRLTTRLPGARAAARIHGLGSFGVTEGTRLDLVADTLHIDGEEQRCTVVWRRSVPLPHEGALAAVRVVAGVELPGAPITWAPPPPRRAGRAEATGPVSQLGRAGTIFIAEEAPASGARPVETAFLEPEEALAATGREVIPFRPAQATPAATVALGPEENAAASVRNALPFERAPAPGAAPSAGLGAFAATPVDAATLFETATPTPLAATADVGIERYAALAVQLSERRAPRADVLGAHGLTEARFAEIERRWTSAMDEEDRRGGHAIRDAYDAAYIKEWETQRRPFELADYARLTVAAERGHLAAALDSLGIRRTLWIRLKRVWARRLAESRSLAAALQRELARQRELRSADAHGMARDRMRAPGS